MNESECIYILSSTDMFFYFRIYILSKKSAQNIIKNFNVVICASTTQGYINRNAGLQHRLHICKCIYTYMWSFRHTHIYTCMYIYIYSEREREADTFHKIEPKCIISNGSNTIMNVDFSLTYVA